MEEPRETSTETPQSTQINHHTEGQAPDYSPLIRIGSDDKESENASKPQQQLLAAPLHPYQHKERHGSAQSRVTNNVDLSDESRMTQVNLISGSTQPLNLQETQQSQVCLSQMGQKRDTQMSHGQQERRPTDDQPNFVRNLSHHIDTGKVEQAQSVYNKEQACTPKPSRQRDSFYAVQIPFKVIPGTMSKDTSSKPVQGGKKNINNTQHTQQEMGYQVSEVVSIGTKHRPSITQLSNDIQLQQFNNVINQGQTKIEAHSNNDQGEQYHHVYKGVAVNKSGQGVSTLQGSAVKASMSLRQSSSFHQQPLKMQGAQEQHIISIFDKETEKSYLLERQVLVPAGLAPADAAAQNGPSIFKVQEVGTAKFKCLAVTDYGKIMSLHKQRQQRKVSTADGSTQRRNYRNSGRTNYLTEQQPQTSQIASANQSIKGGNNQRSVSTKRQHDLVGVTSAETFHMKGTYKSKFPHKSHTSAQIGHKARSSHVQDQHYIHHQKVPAPSMPQPGLQAVSGRSYNQNYQNDRSRKRQNVCKTRPTSHDHGQPVAPSTSTLVTSAVLNGRELRNSRSTATSGGVFGAQNYVPQTTTASGTSAPRKEVFSKSYYLNEQDVAVSQQRTFKTRVPLSSQTSSNMFAETLNLSKPYLEDSKLHQQASRFAIGGASAGVRTRTTTARTAKGSATTKQLGGVLNRRLAQQSPVDEELTVRCCCPEGDQDHMSSNTCGEGTPGGYQAIFSPQSNNCLQCINHATLRPQLIPNSDIIEPETGSGQQFMRKRAQSQGGVRTRHFTRDGIVSGPPSSSGRPNSKARQNKHAALTKKLMAIASDLRQNILPKEHSQVSDTYRKRIENYLSLLAIHGEPNKNLVNAFFNQANIGEEESSHLLNELFEQISSQQVLSQGHHHDFADHQTHHMNGGITIVPSQPYNEAAPQGNKMPHGDEIAGIFQGLEMIDNVRPLRTNIIASVRAMPSYFEGRVRKDPLKPTQFELKVGEGSESCTCPDSLCKDKCNCALNDHENVSGVRTPQATTLQAVLTQNREKLLNPAGIHGAKTAANLAPLTQKNMQQQVPKPSKDKLIQNKKNMVKVSKDEVDRMLFRAGLASPTLIKREHNENLRRAWANRRVTEKATTLSNMEAFVMNDPPTSPLLKQTQLNSVTERVQSQTPQEVNVKIDQFNAQIDSVQTQRGAEFVMSVEQMRLARIQGQRDVRSVSPNHKPSAIRKSLTLSQNKSVNKAVDLVGHLKQETTGNSNDSDEEGMPMANSQHHDTNLSPLDEASFMHLAPVSGNDHQVLHGQLVPGQQLSGITNPRYAQVVDQRQLFIQQQQAYAGQQLGQAPGQNPYQSFGMNEFFRQQQQAAFNNNPEGFTAGQDLNHILMDMNHAVNTRNQMAGGGQGPVTNQKGLVINDQATQQFLGGMPLGQKQPLAGRFSPNGTFFPQSSASPGLQGTSGAENQKMVKTYEFHLPMHHIREEEHRGHADANGASSHPQSGKQGAGSAAQMAASNSRYNLSKQSTVYRLTKKPTRGLHQNQYGGTGTHTGMNRRDDISSQMLENETVADPQNSLRNLNFVGSSFYANDRLSTNNLARLNQSQTQIRKKGGQAQGRNAHIAQSLEAVRLAEKQDSAGVKKRTGAGVVSQSIEFANQVTHQQKIHSPSGTVDQIEGVDSPGGKTMITSKTDRRIIKKPMSNLTNRVGMSPSAENSSPVVRTGKRSRGATMIHNKMGSSSQVRNSPLICLSQQELLQQHKNTAKVTEGNNSADPAEGTTHVAHKQLPINLMRIRTHDSAKLSQGTGASQIDGRKSKSPRSPPKKDSARKNKDIRVSNLTKANHSQGHNTSSQNQNPERIDLQGKPQTLDCASGDSPSKEIVHAGHELKKAGTIEPHSERLGDYAGSDIPGGYVDQNKKQAVTQPADEETPGQLSLMDRLQSQPADAYLILHSEGGQSELLEINQKNFELFGKQLDSAVKLTGSSLSIDDQQKMGTLAAPISSGHENEEGSQVAHTGTANSQAIEVINISQGVQTQTPLRHANATTPPQISQMYVHSQRVGSESRESKTDPAEMLYQSSSPMGHESKMAYFKKLIDELDQGEPKQKQVRVQNFKTKMPKRTVKSASGYPAQNRMNKSFKQPSFRQAQMFMPSSSSKAAASSTPGGQKMLNELRGKQRFKTFKANNELYMRIDSVKSDPNSESAADKNIFDVLLKNLRDTGLPSSRQHLCGSANSYGSDEQAVQGNDCKRTEKPVSSQNPTPNAKEGHPSQFKTLDYQTVHKPECPLHELEAYEAQETLWAQQIGTIKDQPTAGKQGEESRPKASDTRQITHSSNGNLSGLSKYHSSSPNYPVGASTMMMAAVQGNYAEQRQGEGGPGEKTITTTKMNHISLQDYDGQSTVIGGKASNSNTTLISNTNQQTVALRNFNTKQGHSQVKSEMDEMRDTIRKQPKKRQVKPASRLTVDITQPVLWKAKTMGQKVKAFKHTAIIETPQQQQIVTPTDTGKKSKPFEPMDFEHLSQPLQVKKQQSTSPRPLVANLEASTPTSLIKLDPQGSGTPGQTGGASPTWPGFGVRLGSQSGTTQKVLQAVKSSGVRTPKDGGVKVTSQHAGLKKQSVDFQVLIKGTNPKNVGNHKCSDSGNQTFGKMAKGKTRKQIEVGRHDLMEAQMSTKIQTLTPYAQTNTDLHLSTGAPTQMEGNIYEKMQANQVKPDDPSRSHSSERGDVAQGPEEATIVPMQNFNDAVMGKNTSSGVLNTLEQGDPALRLDHKYKPLSLTTKSGVGSSKRRHRSQARNNSRDEAEKNLRMTNLVLQVYADKKHNRRQISSLNSQRSNTDLPFALGTSGAQPAQPIKRAIKISTPRDSQKKPAASKHQDKEQAMSGQPQPASSGLQTDPEALKNMLQSKTAPVVVPRDATNSLFKVQGAGLDRAINYINFEAHQRPSAASNGKQTEMHGQQPIGMPHAHHQIDDQSSVSERLSQIKQHRRHAEPVNSSLDSDQYQQLLLQTSQKIGMAEAEMHSIASTAQLNHAITCQASQPSVSGGAGEHQTNNSQKVYGPATFTSMVRGRACQEHTSLNQEMIYRYEEAKSSIYHTQQSKQASNNQLASFAPLEQFEAERQVLEEQDRAHQRQIEFHRQIEYQSQSAGGGSQVGVHCGGHRKVRPQPGDRSHLSKTRSLVQKSNPSVQTGESPNLEVQLEGCLDENYLQTKLRSSQMTQLLNTHQASSKIE